jgi:hypothetical protein
MDAGAHCHYGCDPRVSQPATLPLNGLPVGLRPLTPPKSASGPRTPYLGSLNARGTSTGYAEYTSK